MTSTDATEIPTLKLSTVQTFNTKTPCIIVTLGLGSKLLTTPLMKKIMKQLIRLKILNSLAAKVPKLHKVYFGLPKLELSDSLMIQILPNSFIACFDLESACKSSNIIVFKKFPVVIDGDYVELCLNLIESPCGTGCPFTYYMTRCEDRFQLDLKTTNLNAINDESNIPEATDFLVNEKNEDLMNFVQKYNKGTVLTRVLYQLVCPKSGTCNSCKDLEKEVSKLVKNEKALERALLAAKGQENQVRGVQCRDCISLGNNLFLANDKIKHLKDIIEEKRHQPCDYCQNFKAELTLAGEEIVGLKAELQNYMERCADSEREVMRLTQNLTHQISLYKDLMGGMSNVKVEVVPGEHPIKATQTISRGFNFVKSELIVEKLMKNSTEMVEEKSNNITPTNSYN